MFRTLATITLCIALAEPETGAGQDTAQPVRVVLGFGVDTATASSQEIFRVWKRYLTGPPSCEQSSPLWSATERARWHASDLLCPYVYQGFTKFTVVHLAPAVGFDSTFMIRTLVSSVSDQDQDVYPLALYRVYVTREDGRWVLANALPRLTRHWQREKLGRVTFVFPPAHRFDRNRAGTTATFVDSLATAFAVIPPEAIEYVFTDDLAETLAAAGLEFFPLASDTVGGRSQSLNSLVLVGSSASGEGYRHEVAHLVLAPFLAAYNPARLVAEGLATWTGGSAGLEFSQLMPDLNQYLEAHPGLTLEGILADPPPRVGSVDVGYGGLAVLCLMVHEVAGLTGLREFVNTGSEPKAVTGTAARLLRIELGSLNQAWRSRIRQLASR